MTSHLFQSPPDAPTPPPWRHALFIGVLQLCAYFVVTLNMRAVAELDYLMTAVTDVFLAAIAFTSIQRVAAATSRTEQVCYIIGGLLGAQLALLWSEYGWWWVSK